MTLRNADNQSPLLNEASPAGKDVPGPERIRRFWKAFLMVLLRTLSAWTVCAADTSALVPGRSPAVRAEGRLHPRGPRLPRVRCHAA